MRNIMLKEMKLSASILSYIFILFSLMFFLPGYPVLCGVFFVTLGIFQSFQNAAETNDILFSALLPIKKRDVVKGKYLFVCFIELCALVMMCIIVLIRMTVLSEAEVYRSNALMNANAFALGVAFLMFGIFNSVFLGGFFKTAYKVGPPFVKYIILAFVTLGAAEAIHHFPGLEFFNAFGTDCLTVQIISLVAGIAAYIMLSFISYQKSCARFEAIDL